MTSGYLTKVKAALDSSLKPVMVLYFTEFTNKYGGADEAIMDTVMMEYASQLVACRITSDMLKHGIARLKTLQYRPNPYQFAQLCKPTAEDLGFPSCEAVFKEITRRHGVFRGQPFDYSHLMVEIIDSRIGDSIYKMYEDKARERLQGEYDYWLDRGMREGLPQPRKAITVSVPSEAPIDFHIARTGWVAKPDSPVLKRLNELRSQQKGLV